MFHNIDKLSFLFRHKTQDFIHYLNGPTRDPCKSTYSTGTPLGTQTTFILFQTTASSSSA